MLAFDVPQRDIDRSELYDADELFACGSASEIVPIVEIDGYKVGGGSIGPVVDRLSKLYAGAVRGEGGSPEWLTPVYGNVPRPTGDLFQGDN